MARVIGVETALARLKGMSGDAIADPIGRALYATADAIKADAQISITNGAVSGKGHVPSRPGEPPNQDTGLLANSIEAALVDPFKATVSSNAPYAAALEYGTSKMAERPYMRPAVEKNRGLLAENIGKAVEYILSKASPPS